MSEMIDALPLVLQAVLLAVIKKLTYDDEYNFENEVSEEEATLWWWTGDRVAQMVCVVLREKTRPCSWSTGSS